MARIRVTRRLDNRSEGLADDSPRAMDLHRLRAQALHEIFDHEQDWKVVQWGDTDDTRPHEDVTLFVSFLHHVAQHAPILNAALGLLGDVLLHVGMEVPLAIAMEKLVKRFREKGEENALAQATIEEGPVTLCCSPRQETIVYISSRVAIPDAPKSRRGPASSVAVPVLVPLSKVNEVAKVLASKKSKP